MATLGPLTRGAADLKLALDVLAGPDPTHAVAWRLELPPPRAASLRGYRVAVWLDDEYCPVDTEVLRVLGAAADAIEAAGTRVDAAARPCSLRTAERLAQRLIQAQLSGAYPAEEYDRLRVVAAAAAAFEAPGALEAPCARSPTDRSPDPSTPATASSTCSSTAGTWPWPPARTPRSTPTSSRRASPWSNPGRTAARQWQPRSARRHPRRCRSTDPPRRSARPSTLNTYAALRRLDPRWSIRTLRVSPARWRRAGSRADDTGVAGTVQPKKASMAYWSGR